MLLPLLASVGSAHAESPADATPTAATGTVEITIEGAEATRIVEERIGFKLAQSRLALCTGPCSVQAPSGVTIVELETFLGGKSKSQFTLPAGGKATLSGRMGSQGGRTAGAILMGVGGTCAIVLPPVLLVVDIALWITDGNEFGPKNSVLPAAAWSIVGGLAAVGVGAGLYVVSLPRVEVELESGSTASLHPWVGAGNAGFTVSL